MVEGLKPERCVERGDTYCYHSEGNECGTDQAFCFDAKRFPATQPGAARDRDSLAAVYSRILLESFGTEIVKSATASPLKDWEPTIVRSSYRLADLMIAEALKPVVAFQVDADALTALTQAKVVLTAPTIGTHDMDDPEWYNAVDLAVAKIDAVLAKVQP